MRYLNTYESWGQTFKIVRAEDDHFYLWIHQKNDSLKLQIQRDELEELSEFLTNFIRDND